MIINEKDWLILQTIYEEGNITKASERLYITQPALTYRLKQLEREFGTQIVTRGKKGVEFTLQGHYLVQYASEMILKLRKTKEHLQNMEQNVVKGTLRIGVSRTFARYKLPGILKSFHLKYPDIEFQVKTGWSSEISHMLRKEEVHLGIVRGNSNWQEEKYLLYKEPICIASKDPFDINQLPSLPRISYQTDQTLKSLIDTWWQDRFTTSPNITMDVDQIETCKEMVLNGLGYAILPSICLNPEDSLYTVEINSIHSLPLYRETWILNKDNSLELTVVRVFIDFLKEHFGTSIAVEK